ncbi:MAG: hypothetical protein DMD86_11430 [Candidatus Rokuibacteriota bacterium]|nr:MAG: hypothetical protein DMD86_11430 [Candidatus Rokubacteria bacterium]
MVRTLFHLDEAIHARLRDLARKKGRTVSELVREPLVGPDLGSLRLHDTDQPERRTGGARARRRRARRLRFPGLGQSINAA